MPHEQLSRPVDGIRTNPAVIGIHETHRPIDPPPDREAPTPTSATQHRKDAEPGMRAPRSDTNEDSEQP